MSVSKKYNQLVTVARALGRDTITFKHNEMPSLKGFKKVVPVLCRRCKGVATEGETTDNCPQCGGKGVEKLSMKAYNRELMKQQVAVKTAPEKEQEDLHEKEDSK